MTLRLGSLSFVVLALSLPACGDDENSGEVAQSSTPGDDAGMGDDASGGADESPGPVVSQPPAPDPNPGSPEVPNPAPNVSSGGPGGSGNGSGTGGSSPANGGSGNIGVGNANGAGAAGSAAVGGNEAVGGSEAKGGSAGIPECEQVQCLRAFECVRECGATPEYVGCCPCEDGTIDSITCSMGDAGAGSGGTECSALLDPVIDSDALMLTVQNDRTVPIGLGGPVSCQPTLFTLRSLDEALVWGGDHCSFTCEMLMDGVGGCTADCPSPQPVVLQPGESMQISWHGVGQRITPLPPECCDEMGLCPSECGVPQLAEVGQYIATLNVVELTEEQATACEEEPYGENCPDVLNGFGTATDLTELPFAITSRDEPVLLTID